MNAKKLTRFALTLALLLGLGLLSGCCCLTGQCPFLKAPQAVLIAEEDLLETLEALPGAEVEKTRSRDDADNYTIKLTQPLDHEDPAAGSFVQYLYLRHVGLDRPMVLNTSGYAASSPRGGEPAELLEANVLTVEHRYHGRSKPEAPGWDYLTATQAAADHHRVTELFKPIYQEKWIGTGASKGGTTALLHRYFYPKDVDVTVAFVAPMNQAQEDPRHDVFLKEIVGDEEWREKIWQFQRLVLSSREEIVPLLEAEAERRNWTFAIGVEQALEYSVVEYPFAYWQNGHYSAQGEDIPVEGASAEELFKHLLKVSMYSLYEKSGIEGYEPAFYQFITELGYYGFMTEHLAELISAERHPTNVTFAPIGVDTAYRQGVMAKALKWLQNKGDNIIYIYGGNDPWSATGVTPHPRKTNALKFVKEGGAHSTRIGSLDEADQEKIYAALEKWLDIKIKR